MQLFAIGQTVKLAQYTGDDQIDAHYGAVLEVTEFRTIRYEVPFSNGRYDTIPNYTLVNVETGIGLTANEYELRDANA